MRKCSVRARSTGGREGRGSGDAVYAEVKRALGVVDDVGSAHDDDGVPGAGYGNLVARQRPTAVSSRRGGQQVLAEVRARQADAHALDASRVVKIDAQHAGAIACTGHGQRGGEVRCLRLMFSYWQRDMS